MPSTRFISVSMLGLLSVALLLRVFLAYVALPDAYISGDVRAYAYWGMAMAEVGPGGFYEKLASADYPPAYLYIMWAVAEVGRIVAAITHSEPAAVTASLMKIPPILFDVAAGLMIYRIARRWAESNAERIALVAAALYLFNPVTCYDAAIWGQTDSVGACMLLLAVIALVQWPSEIAAAVAAIAGLIKPQFGVVLVPLIGAVLLRRHLLLDGHLTSVELHRREYWLGRNGPMRLAASVLVAVGVFYAVITPFHLDAQSFFERMSRTVTGYPFVTVNAFNPWALVSVGEAPSIFQAIPQIFDEARIWPRDDVPLLGSLTGADIGTGLIALGFLLGVARLLWRADRCSIVCVGVFLCLCFFMLPTRVHERYLVPVFGLVCLLAAFDRKWLWAMMALSIAALINLHSIFSMVDQASGERVHLPLTDALLEPPVVLLSVALHTAVFCFTIWRLRPKSAHSEMPWQAVAVGASR